MGLAGAIYFPDVWQAVNSDDDPDDPAKNPPQNPPDTTTNDCDPSDPSCLKDDGDDGDDGFKTSKKIDKQIEKRGWTRESIRDTIKNPDRTDNVQDTRYLLGGGQMNDPATAYVRSDGSYVIRNNVTNEIVQVSNRFDPNWITPF